MALAGGDIHLDRYAAPAAPLTVVLHGAGGYGRLLAPYGRLLQAHGFEVVLPDLPGYGLSVAPAALSTYAALGRLRRGLASKRSSGARGRPVALFGMSIGGYLAYLAAAQGRKAAAASSPPPWPTSGCRSRGSGRQESAAEPGVRIPCSGPWRPCAAACALPIRWFANMEGRERSRNRPPGVPGPERRGKPRAVRFLRSLLAVRPAIEPEDFDLWSGAAGPARGRPLDDHRGQPALLRPIKGPKELVMLENCGHLPIEEPGISRLEEAVVGFFSKPFPGQECVTRHYHGP